MTSHYLNLLAGLIIATTLAGQPAFQWVKTFDGYNALSKINTVETCIDSSENLYASGNFEGTFDFDPGQGTYTLQNPGSHVFVSKLNASGDFEWARCFSGAGQSNCWGMCTDAAGNVFLSGHYTGQVDFDPGPGSYVSTTPGPAYQHFDSFVVKLDAQGNFNWAKFIGAWSSQGETFGVDIASDAAGNCYVTGMSTSIQPGIIFTTKYDGQGNLLWMKQINRGSGSTSTAIHVDLFGNVYTAGVFYGNIDFDPGPGTFTLGSTNGSKDVFIQKLDGAGNFIWVKQLGGNCNDECKDICSDAAGNIYTVGHTYTSTICSGDFDPGPDVYTLQFHAFLSKLDPAGNFVWAKALVAETPPDPALGPPGIVFLSNCLALDGNSNIYVTGSRNGPTDFDPGPGIFNIPGPIGVYYRYYLKLDSAGNFVWAFSIQFSPFSLAVNGKNGDIYSSGMYGEDFDPGPATYTLNPSPFRSAFVHKLSYSAGVMGIDDYALPYRYLNLFPNPNNGRFTLSGNFKRSSKYQLIDALGRELKTATFENGSVLDFSDLNLFKGLYLLRVFEDDKWSQIPFLIE